MKAVWHDGRLRPEAEAPDERTQRGAFETVGAVGGALPLWPVHERRLQLACAALDLPWPPPCDLRAAAEHLLAHNGDGDGVARVQVSDPAVGGTCLSVRSRPRVAVPEPLLLAPAPHPRQPQAADRFKVTPRAELDALRRWAVDQGADDALCWAPDGRLLEATTYSLVLEGEEGVLRTPELDGGGVLAGVSRALLLAAAAEVGVDLQPARLHLEDLARAGRIWVTNAVSGPRRAWLGEGPLAIGPDPLTDLWRWIGQSPDPLRLARLSDR